jgi:multidrug resistance efflux pump
MKLPKAPSVFKRDGGEKGFHMKPPKAPSVFKPDGGEKRFPWGKIVYLGILTALAASLLWWVGKKVIYIDGSAVVEAREFQVQCTETGRIESIPVKVGEAVTPDVVVARLDVTQRLQDQWSPEAIQRIESSVKKLDADMAVAARELALRSALAGNLGQEKDRTRDLLEQRVIKFSDYKRIELEHQGMMVEVGRLQKLVATLNQQRELLKEIYCRFKGCQAEVKVDLKPTIEGVVIRQEKEPGDVVLAGQPVLTLMDPKTLFIRAYFEEKHYPYLAVGGSVTIIFKDGFRDGGRITKIYPASAFLPSEYQEHYMPRQRSIACEICPDHPQPERMLPGQTVITRVQKVSRLF